MAKIYSIAKQTTLLVMEYIPRFRWLFWMMSSSAQMPYQIIHIHGNFEDNMYWFPAITAITVAAYGLSQQDICRHSHEQKSIKLV